MCSISVKGKWFLSLPSICLVLFAIVVLGVERTRNLWFVFIIVEGVIRLLSCAVDKMVSEKDLQVRVFALFMGAATVSVAFLFALVYTFATIESAGLMLASDKSWITDFMDCFYFSIVTLFTVGYGDIVPVGVFRYFVIVEIFMGLVYIGSIVYILTKHLDSE